MSYLSTLVSRLRTAGIEPGDSDELKLKKSLLMFAMGLTTASPVLCLVTNTFTPDLLFMSLAL